MKKKICAVSSCRNGQTYTSAKTKKLGLKNKSLFKAPKVSMEMELKIMFVVFIN